MPVEATDTGSLRRRRQRGVGKFFCPNAPLKREFRWAADGPASLVMSMP